MKHRMMKGVAILLATTSSIAMAQSANPGSAGASSSATTGIPSSGVGNATPGASSSASTGIVTPGTGSMNPAAASTPTTTTTTGPGTFSNSSKTTTQSNTGNWKTESTYWRNQYTNRPYYNSSRDYTTYEPAYRYGVDLYNRNPNLRYEDLNSTQLESGWNQTRGNSSLNWSDAQMAVRDAYNRMHTNRNTNPNTMTR